jgi:hypothetical protein
MPSSHAGASLDAPYDIYLDTHRTHGSRLAAHSLGLGLTVGIAMLESRGPKHDH